MLFCYELASSTRQIHRQNSTSTQREEKLRERGRAIAAVLTDGGGRVGAIDFLNNI
jgi:hypothetical protein